MRSFSLRSRLTLLAVVAVILAMLGAQDAHPSATPRYHLWLTRSERNEIAAVLDSCG